MSEKQTKETRAFRELERGSASSAARAMVEAQEADEKAAAARSTLTVAVQREHDRYHVLLTKELDWLGRRIDALEGVALSEEGSYRAEREEDIVAAKAWRGLLEKDLEVLDHPPDGAQWTEIKKRIERDLDENRPPSIPRSYEKPYGI